MINPNVWEINYSKGEYMNKKQDRNKTILVKLYPNTKDPYIALDMVFNLLNVDPSNFKETELPRRFEEFLSFNEKGVEFSGKGSIWISATNDGALVLRGDLISYTNVEYSVILEMWRKAITFTKNPLVGNPRVATMGYSIFNIPEMSEFINGSFRNLNEFEPSHDNPMQLKDGVQRMSLDNSPIKFNRPKGDNVKWECKKYIKNGRGKFLFSVMVKNEKVTLHSKIGDVTTIAKDLLSPIIDGEQLTNILEMNRASYLENKHKIDANRTRNKKEKFGNRYDPKKDAGYKPPVKSDDDGYKMSDVIKYT